MDIAIPTAFNGILPTPDGKETRVERLPMSSAESISGALASYFDPDSPLGTNLYAPVCVL